jgi:nucleotide-binding universal stress UspA family protein
MYQRIVLAYDGSVEGRAALREGAMLAMRLRARVFLLSVAAETPGRRLAEGAYAGVIAHEQEAYRAVLEEGVTGLRQLGLEPVAELRSGEPAAEIAAFVEQVAADLLVVGHRHRSFLDRWWAGSSGAYLMDRINCSMLIAGHLVSDEALVDARGRGNE